MNAGDDDDDDTAATLALAQWKRQDYLEKLGFDIWTDEHKDVPSSFAQVRRVALFPCFVDYSTGVCSWAAMGTPLLLPRRGLVELVRR